MSEIEVLHRNLLQRPQSVFSMANTAPRAAATQPPMAASDPLPAPAEVEAEAEAEPDDDDGLYVNLTPESRDNIQRAPAGTRFFCVADTEGTTHCAASRARDALSDSQKSTLGGDLLEPIAPSYAGTGHQQVARAAGIGFDEATARVGYVDGDGYGLSIEKVNDCQRNYSFRSAFNRKCSPEGGREMPAEFAERFERGIENAFPACIIGDSAP